jgi:hypothetical protein
LACHRSRRHQRRSSPLTGYLIERWFNGPFAFHDVRHVVGVIAAAGFAAAVYGIGGGAAVNLLSTTAPFWEVWRSWSLSGAVGSVMVAPLLIGLAQLWRERPSKGEWSEGLGVLALLVSTCVYTVTQPSGSWGLIQSGRPCAAVLFWLTARGRPAFGIAGPFIAAAAILLGTIFRMAVRCLSATASETLALASPAYMGKTARRSRPIAASVRSNPTGTKRQPERPS